MRALLKRFYENENEREAVKAFLIECLEELAIERVMKKENTDAIADAKEVIENSFTRLKEEFEETPKTTPHSSR